MPGWITPGRLGEILDDTRALYVTGEHPAHAEPSAEELQAAVYELGVRLERIAHKPVERSGITVCARCGYVPSRDRPTCCAGRMARVTVRKDAPDAG